MRSRDKSSTRVEGECLDGGWKAFPIHSDRQHRFRQRTISRRNQKLGRESFAHLTGSFEIGNPSFSFPLARPINLTKFDHIANA